MKTKELIRLLQEEDPEGETECCIGNADIRYVAKMPSYYDGNLQVLKRENEKITGIKLTSVGSKVNLYMWDLEDVLLDDPEAEVDLSELGNEETKKRYARLVEDFRKEGRDLKEFIENLRKEKESKS